MSSLSNNKNNGFSLVELVTVLLIITVLSTIAIRSTVDIGYAARYEQTVDRLESIRKGTVGDPEQLINGQPDIYGFVADMGRLPINIHELIEEDFCITDRTVTDQTTCEALNSSSGVWNDQPSTITDGNTNLKYGWNGPYLNISDDPTRIDTYTDGWGRGAQGFCSTDSDTNTLPAACPDVTESEWVDEISDHNYGWYFQQDVDDLILLSYGKDHISGGNDYDEDYPTLKPVVRDDWLVDISGGIQVTFTALLTINTNDRNACIQASGTWKNGCEIDEATCESTLTTVASPALWISTNENIDPDPDPNSFNFCKMGETSCKTGRGTDPRAGSWKTCHFLSKQSCLLARGEWREKYSENTDTTCNDVTDANNCGGFTRPECEAGAGVWDAGKCFTCDITVEELCTASGGEIIGVPGTTYPGLSNCKTNGGNWDTTASLCRGANYCEFNGVDGSQQCRNIGGNWSEACQFDRKACTDITLGGINADWDVIDLKSECSTELPPQLLFQSTEAAYDLQDIVMEITYRDNGILGVAQSTNAVVQENGKSQTVLFTGFDNNGTAINELPIGVNAILIAKNYNFGTDVGDIYPASCEGLERDSDGNGDTDCFESGGVLLDSGLCDSVTIAECETGADGTAGRLIRNVRQVSFVPRKITPLIIW